MNAQVAEGVVVPRDNALNLLDLGRCRYYPVLVVGPLQREGAPTNRFVNGDGAGELKHALDRLVGDIGVLQLLDEKEDVLQGSGDHAEIVVLVDAVVQRRA